MHSDWSIRYATKNNNKLTSFFQTKIMKLFRSLIFSSKRLNSNLAFVPTHQDPSDQHLEALKTLLNAGEKPNKGKFSLFKALKMESGFSGFSYFFSTILFKVNFYQFFIFVPFCPFSIYPIFRFCLFFQFPKKLFIFVHFQF